MLPLLFLFAPCAITAQWCLLVTYRRSESGAYPAESINQARHAMLDFSINPARGRERARRCSRSFIARADRNLDPQADQYWYSGSDGHFTQSELTLDTHSVY